MLHTSWSEACGCTVSWSFTRLLFGWHWINVQWVWKAICAMKITSYHNLSFESKLYTTFFALNSFIRGQEENEAFAINDLEQLDWWPWIWKLLFPVLLSVVGFADVWVILLLVKHICTFLWHILNKGEIMKKHLEYFIICHLLFLVKCWFRFSLWS